MSATKVTHSQLEGEEPELNRPDSTNRERPNKQKKHDVELPVAEVDVKLAERLDNCLKLSDTRKARFFMNKPNASGKQQTSPTSTSIKQMGSIKPKNLTREELRERLLKKYDTLVPELDSKRTSVKLVKILSAKESLEMGMEHAKKQLVDQMKLNSISGNHRAYLDGIDSFRFNDGYEMPSKNFYSKKFDIFQKSKNGSPPGPTITTAANRRVEELTDRPTTRTTRSNNNLSKSVKFADQTDIEGATGDFVSNPYDFFAPDSDDENLTDENDEEEAKLLPDQRQGTHVKRP